MKSHSSETGMTLIEIMIVVAIIGIISTLAYPTYQAHILKTHRTTAKALLLEILTEQQNFYARNMTYTNALNDLGYTLINGGVETTDGRYNITAGNCIAPLSNQITVCVRLTATAQGTQLTDGNLVANSAGGKAPENKW